MADSDPVLPEVVRPVVPQVVEPTEPIEPADTVADDPAMPPSIDPAAVIGEGPAIVENPLPSVVVANPDAAIADSGTKVDPIAMPTEPEDPIVVTSEGSLLLIRDPDLDAWVS
jgi:hypothetical protein